MIVLGGTALLLLLRKVNFGTPLGIDIAALVPISNKNQTASNHSDRCAKGIYLDMPCLPNQYYNQIDQHQKRILRKVNFGTPLGIDIAALVLLTLHVKGAKQVPFSLSSCFLLDR